MKTNKYGVTDRKEYRRLWMRDFRKNNPERAREYREAHEARVREHRRKLWQDFLDGKIKEYPYIPTRDLFTVNTIKKTPKRRRRAKIMERITRKAYYDAGLLPCPLCGAPPAGNANEAMRGGVYLQETHIPEARRGLFDNPDTFAVICCRCYVRITRTGKEAAVSAWNSRV